MFIHDEMTYKNTPKLAILLEYENLNSLKLFSRLLISISIYFFRLMNEWTTVLKHLANYIISSSKNLLFLKSVVMMILFASNLHLFMRRPAKQRATEKENFQKSHGNSSMIEMFEQRFHPFSGWVFFHKASNKKVQGMPTCLGCVASEILDVDICTKSAKAMSSYKQDRNL